MNGWVSLEDVDEYILFNVRSFLRWLNFILDWGI